MGVSTDAVLFFGYAWSEERELLAAGEDGDQPDWRELILRQRGLVDPWDSYPSEEVAGMDYQAGRKLGDEWCKSHRAELDAWNEAKRALEGEFGCDIGRHCSRECPMPCVYVSASVFSARRGCPERVPSHLPALPEWQEMLARFMAALDISPPEDQTEPAWWLVSYWG